MSTIAYREPVQRALREEMRRDPADFDFGEDVAEAGGVFKATAGLLAEFGPRRIFDTPISESALAGVAVGAAMMGLRPVLEIMFGDFTTIAMDGIVNSAAKVRFLSAGEYSAPMVIRMTYGAGARWGAQHTQSPESWLMNVPGLTMVMPSTPYDLYGLLKTAVRSPDPVIVLEHKNLYGHKGEVPEEEYFIPFGKAVVRRDGSDATIAATGAMVDRALAAAERLGGEGVSVEVIDIRSVIPLDVATLVESVTKTGRMVVLHEAPVFGGFGAEVASAVGKAAFGYLDAPIERIGGAWSPIPFGQVLVDEYLPSEQDVVDAVRRTLSS
jgi:acetoin:2,6-dichlorophenolindophenol oxidoreductase subunit beta